MMSNITSDVKRVLVDEETLAHRIAQIGKQIETDYADKDLILVGVLKGSVVFMVDLMKQIQLPLTIDFMAVSSYGSGTTSSGHVKIIKDLSTDIAGKDILLVEDILDSGNTLSYLIKMLESRGAASIKICALLNKPERRQANITLNYEGFVIPDEFVIGYGLDYDEHYRNLPYIGVLREEVYQNKE